MYQALLHSLNGYVLGAIILIVLFGLSLLLMIVMVRSKQAKNHKSTSALATEPIPTSRSSAGSSSSHNKNPSKYVDIESMLYSLGGELSAVKTLLEVFIDDHSGDWEQFIKAVNHQQQDDALRIVHSLKGVAGAIGATELSRAASSLEHCMKGQKVPTEKQLAVLESSLLFTLNDVKRLLASPQFIELSE